MNFNQESAGQAKEPGNTALPNENMVIAGFEAVSLFQQTDAYENMTGCQGAAESARICWAAMVAYMPEGEAPRQDFLPSDAVIQGIWAEESFARYGAEAASGFARTLLARYGKSHIAAQPSVPDGWAVKRVGDAIHLEHPNGQWCGYMLSARGGPAHDLTYDFLNAMLAAAPPAGVQAIVPNGPSAPLVDDLVARWDDDGATRGPAYMELRDLARHLERVARQPPSTSQPKEPDDQRDQIASEAHPPSRHCMCVECAPSFEPTSGEDARPDMFWNADDPEQCQDSIHNLLVKMQGNRFFYVGDVVEVQQAVKLPNIFVRITSAEDDEGNGDMEYEVVDAAMQQGDQS